MDRRALLLAGLLPFVPGCSSDSTTGPERDGTWVLEEVQSIDGAGGVLRTDGFTLTVPAGALSREHRVRVYASAEEQPFGRYQVTRSFRLQGLPAEFTQPLGVSLEYQGSLSGETYVARGGLARGEVSGDSAQVYVLLQAADSSGYLVGTLPAMGQRPAAPPQRVPWHIRARPAEAVASVLDLVGVTGHGTRLTEHFIIKYPQDLFMTMVPLGQVLEDAHRAVAVDLQLPPRHDQRHMVVVGKVVSRDGAGAFWGFADAWSDYGLYIDRTVLEQGDLTPAGLAAGQGLLASRLRGVAWQSGQPPNRWLEAAVLTWAQELFAAGEGYGHPSVLPGHEMAPFRGMQAGAQAGPGEDPDERSTAHGQGMSAVVKYLVEDPRFGLAGIGTTFTALATGAPAPAALLTTVDALVAQWWPQFFRSYVGGEVYGVGKDVFTRGSNLAGTWTIDDSGDTATTFTGRYPDLSAKLYLVTLSGPRLDESAEMTLTLGGQRGYQEPWGVLAFGVGATSLEYWGQAIGQGSASLRLSGLQNRRDSGARQILVVAVCSNVSDTYLQETDADLQMAITTAAAAGPAFNSLDFGLRVVGHWRHVMPTRSLEYDEELAQEPWLVDVIEGGMTAPHQFTGGLDRQEANGEVVATDAVAVFNASRDTLVSVSVVMNRSVPTIGVTESHSFLAEAIPLLHDDASWSTYRVSGAAVCQCLVDVTHEFQVQASAQPETRTLQGFHCIEDGSSISILTVNMHKRPR